MQQNGDPDVICQLTQGERIGPPLDPMSYGTETDLDTISSRSFGHLLGPSKKEGKQSL